MSADERDQQATRASAPAREAGADAVSRAGTLLLLIRHGATDWNEQGRIQGQSDPPLNATGCAQARSLARRLRARRLPLTAVYSSDLRRARQTAEALAGALGLPLHPDRRLRERDLGPMEGLTYSEGVQRFGDGETLRVSRLPGVEPKARLVARVDLALREIADGAAGECVAVVTHGGAIANWLAAHLPDAAAAQGPIHNGAVVPVRAAPAGWEPGSW